MDLYALPPEEFTAARTEQVKAARAAGDRERATALGALRRPTASAHAVNALVRAEPELVEQLVGLGAALARAQSEGEGAALRELGEQRRQLVEAVAERAAAAVGAPLGPAVRAEVTGTLEAALADPASAEAVRSGRLVRALSYAGFGGVDLDGAVAEATGPAPAAPAAPRRAAPGTTAADRAAEDGRRAEEDRRREAAQRRRAQAQQAALDAAGALDDAVHAAEDAATARDAREAAAEQAAERVSAAEQALQEARAGREEADAARRRAERELVRAHERVVAAQTAAERARAALDRLPP